MRTSLQALFVAVLLLSTPAAKAQAPPENGAASAGTVPLASLIATVAKSTGRKFVLDPRARAPVTLIGENPSSVTYDELLTILGTYGFIAVKSGGYVLILPDAYTREEPLPFVAGSEKLADDQPVTTVIHVRSIPAGFLVPILRPLVPQWGHLAAMVCTNDLIIVDRFASVRRMEAIIKAMDTGAPVTAPKCHYPMSP